MKRVWQLAGAAVTAAALVGGGYVVVRRLDKAPPAAAVTSARVASCALAPGDHGAFRFESVAEAKGVAASPKDTARVLFSWTAVREGVLRGAFTTTEVTQALTEPERRLPEQPVGAFEVEIAPDCAIGRESYPKAWAPITRQFVSTVLRTFELRVASGETWEVEQKDGLGMYTAAYRVNGGVVEKTKRRYRKVEAALPGFDVQVRVVASNVTGLFDPHAWLSAASGRERIRLETKGRLLGDLEQTFRLKRDDAAYVEPPALAEVDATDPFTIAQKPTDTQDPSIAALTQAQVMERFTAKAPSDSYAAALLLAQWLRAHPEQAAVLMATLKNGAMREAFRPAFFLALEQCGTPESRRVLADALADARLGDMDRVRAASALSDVPTPGPEVEKALVTSAADTGPRAVSGSSLRALGHYESRGLDPAAVPEIRATLHDALSGASDPSRQVDAVDAMGNTGDRDFVADLAAQLASPSPTIRLHAARAFRMLAAADARDPLLKRLVVETDANVRVAILETLAAVGARDDDALAIGIGLLPQESNANVRAALIAWLGGAAERPAVRSALAAWFAKEPVPQLQQLIGRFISPDQLP